MMPGMRADATHWFEFEVDGGRSAPFICAARTAAEAERIARHAGASVRLVEAAPIPPGESDEDARMTLARRDLFSGGWRRDVQSLVWVLDRVRHDPGLVASVVPAAFLPPSEIAARGLRSCRCGTKHAGESDERRAVEPAAHVSVVMVEDGGWQLHLSMEQPNAAAFAKLGWPLCNGNHCTASVVANLQPGCSIWFVVLEVLDALLTTADLRPGELSCVPTVPRGCTHP